MSGSHGEEYEDGSPWDIAPCIFVKVNMRPDDAHSQHISNFGQILPKHMARTSRKAVIFRILNAVLHFCSEEASELCVITLRKRNKNTPPNHKF
jgi:hypothetical protein